jgi:hypothetical protein
MSKRHQTSRRRTYGRRQHEIHERTERYAGFLGWIDESEMPGLGDRWDAELSGRSTPGQWLQLRSLD